MLAVCHTTTTDHRPLTLEVWGKPVVLAVLLRITYYICKPVIKSGCGRKVCYSVHGCGSVGEGKGVILGVMLDEAVIVGVGVVLA
jgi:hypothetical protein